MGLSNLSQGYWSLPKARCKVWLIGKENAGYLTVPRSGPARDQLTLTRL